MAKFAEDNFQKAVATYLDLQQVLWTHVANERKTSQQAGRRLKEKGVKSGVPDVLIFTKKNGYSGMAAELKVKPNKITQNQKVWLGKLKAERWYVCLCYDLDEFIYHFQNYYGV